jgi:hypothetical protein
MKKRVKMLIFTRLRGNSRVRPPKGGPDPPRGQKHPQSGKKCLRNTNFPLGLGVFDHSPGVLLKIGRF